MTDYTVKRLARVLSIQAEIEAMKCDNEKRAYMNLSQSYSEKDFIIASTKLFELSVCCDEAL